ncbi:unnamed protein product [Peronospora farinosa]|uniref:CS domain-containing protein n=1 Tax=Peronospora farinosa TaxID=134698 RepID=A0AAV0T0S2_9STRA|nr:unnamed protein product [Peronospora farinosa]
MDAMSAAPGRFDMLLTELAQQHERHKMGFLPGQAQEKVLKAFQKYPMKILDGNDSYNMIAKKNTATIDQVVSAASSIKASCGAKNEPKLTDEGKQFPVGNGGRAGTLHGRRLWRKFQFRWSYNTIKPLLEGEFPEQIRVDESIWSLESNHTLLIILEKTKPTWWASALKGEPEIDTNQVDYRRSIYEYDEVTQGAIRKAVYDQRQYQSNGRVPLTPEEQMLETAKDLPGSPFLSSTQ